MPITTLKRKASDLAMSIDSEGFVRMKIRQAFPGEDGLDVIMTAQEAAIFARDLVKLTDREAIIKSIATAQVRQAVLEFEKQTLENVLEELDSYSTEELLKMR